MLRLRRILGATTLSMLLALTTVLPALAYEQVGSLSCSASKRVWIYSKASVNVYHLWTEGSQYWYNPYRLHKENNTYQTSVGWKVKWNFEKDYAGAECRSI